MVRSNSQLGKLRLEDVYLSQGHTIKKNMGQFSDSNSNVFSSPPSEVLRHQPPIIITAAAALIEALPQVRSLLPEPWQRERLVAGRPAAWPGHRFVSLR